MVQSDFGAFGVIVVLSVCGLAGNSAVHADDTKSSTAPATARIQTISEANLKKLDALLKDMEDMFGPSEAAPHKH